MTDYFNYLILIRGEDKTAKVNSWFYDKNKAVVYITFDNGKRYPYRIRDVQIFTNPRIVPADNCIVLKNNAPVYKIDKLCYFGGYCRIVFQNKSSTLCLSSNIKVITSSLNGQRAKRCFDYLRQIAYKTGLMIDGHNILASRFEKIDFVRSDSVFSAFLTGDYSNQKKDQNIKTVFPFGFNISQKKAVENALSNQLSIIEGPPGTGKTQTILNIIANAVMRGESVAVVSGNNSATANVFEKLEKYDVSFIAAPLGNSANKESFLNAQTNTLPDITSWRASPSSFSALDSASAELETGLLLKNQLADLQAERDALRKEYAFYRDCYLSLQIGGELPIFKPQTAASMVLRFAAEYEHLFSLPRKLGFFKKLSLRLKYQLKNSTFWGREPEIVSAYCQDYYYRKREDELLTRISEIETELRDFDFAAKMKEYTILSMKAFKANLADRYKGNLRRPVFTAEDLWKRPDAFIQSYPVILSTTYSLRACLSNRTVYDYVIIDEASQVDIATGALALSCAKNAVIVGDLKQLPNVVDRETEKVTDEIFCRYELPEAYRYSKNSILSCAAKLFPSAPSVLLKEHYRCHPEIIGFCNQRFYNGELIVMTEPVNERQPLLVYKTVPGNHARGHVNQRQIDVIQNEVIPQQRLSLLDGSLGIVTPYRDQADVLQKTFEGTQVKADTADKFQGQERSVMIFSTVDNEIGEFASDPNRLNVAVSRAIDQFIVVTDGNDNDTTSAIHELIGYIQYHNHEIINSEVRSVFDYLYEKYSVEREQVLKKYGRIAEFDSENLMNGVIREILSQDRFAKYGVVMHVPLRMILSDFRKLNARELSFSTNHLTHVDFLIFSKLTHQPALVIEVDGFAYHNNDSQIERDSVKDAILCKYGIPILRLSTVGSGEKEKIESALQSLQ